MNRFAAYLILCQIDLEEFLELSPEERVERFGAFVGVERMVSREVRLLPFIVFGTDFFELAAAEPGHRAPAAGDASVGF